MKDEREMPPDDTRHDAVLKSSPSLAAPSVGHVIVGLASAALAVPCSVASLEAFSASRADSTARCSTIFTEELISVTDDEVCSAETESVSVFSDTCLIEAIICSMDDAVSSTAAASALALRATSSIEDAICVADDDACTAAWDVSSAFSATPLFVATISFTTIAVCSVASCCTLAP